MTISITEVETPESFENPELETVASLSAKDEDTAWYRVRRDGVDVAFLAVGRRQNHLFTHQLFVPRKARRRGIGSAVLTAVEQFARQEGYEGVRVWPRPLDDSIDRQTLERWYRRRGYEIMAGGTGDMEKRVSGALPERTAQVAAG